MANEGEQVVTVNISRRPAQPLGTDISFAIPYPTGDRQKWTQWTEWCNRNILKADVFCERPYTETTIPGQGKHGV